MPPLPLNCWEKIIYKLIYQFISIFTQQIFTKHPVLSRNCATFRWKWQLIRIKWSFLSYLVFARSVILSMPPTLNTSNPYNSSFQELLIHCSDTHVEDHQSLASPFVLWSAAMRLVASADPSYTLTETSSQNDQYIFKLELRSAWLLFSVPRS